MRQPCLENTDSLDKRKMDLEQLQANIKNMELEIRNINNEAAQEHQRLRAMSVEDLEKDLIEPLEDLKGAIESLVTPDYVRRQIEKESSRIDLPPDVRERYETMVGSLNENLKKQRQAVSERLAQLRLDYAEDMKKYLSVISSSFSALNIEMPQINVSCEMDFSDLQNFYHNKIELESRLEDKLNEVADLESQIAAHAANDGALREARDAVERAERNLQSLGTPPAPVVTTRQVCDDPGGVYRKATYSTVRDVDDSNLRAWEECRDSYRDLLENRENRLKEIMDIEEKKHGRRLSLEAAKKRYENEVKKWRDA